MSRSGAKAKQPREVPVPPVVREVMEMTPEEMEAQQAEFERQQRIGQLFVMCRSKIHGRQLCLWPADALGWYIGEQMFNEAMQRLMAVRAQRQELARQGIDLAVGLGLGGGS